MNPQLSREATAQLRERAGLDQSFWVRYLEWQMGLLRGEFGPSLIYGVDASELLLPRLASTLWLNSCALLLALAIATPAALFAASHSNHWLARGLGNLSQAALMIPEIVVALLLLALAVEWGIPLPGSLTDLGGEGGLPAMARYLQWTFVPCLVLTIGVAPAFFRHIRSAFEEARTAPYVLAARQAGISRRVVYWRYLLPAAANPLISLLGITLGGLLSASLVVETVTAWPGMGPLLLEAVLAQDAYVVVGAVLLAAASLLAGNLAADLLLLRLDPRIRR